MIRPLLAAAPVAITLFAYLAFQALEPSRGDFRIVGLIARAAAALGCFVAAAQFDRADYLRRAWTFYALGFVFLFANALIFGTASVTEDREVPVFYKVAGGGLVVIANVLTVLATLMVARAWRKAGLTLTVSTRAQVLVTLGSIAAGLLVVGGTTYNDFQLLLGGNLDAITYLASDLGDLITLALLGPILLTALALRGGSLAWPWSLIVLGTFGWLCLDATVTIAGLLDLAAASARPLEEAFRILACASFLSAGLLQRLAVRGAHAGAVAAA